MSAAFLLIPKIAEFDQMSFQTMAVSAMSFSALGFQKLKVSHFLIGDGPARLEISMDDFVMGRVLFLFALGSKDRIKPDIQESHILGLRFACASGMFPPFV